MLVLVCGLPATGKSTVSRNIATKLKATILSTDIIRKKLFSKPTYSSEEKRLIYKTMLLVAEYLLRSDRNVVLDGTFYKRSLRQKVYNVSKKTGSRLAIVECRATNNNIKRRMGRRSKRKNDPSDADYEVYKKIRGEFEPISRKHLVLDTSKSKQKNIEEISRHLNLN